MNIEWYWMLALLLGGVSLFIASGMPVAIAFLIVNLLGAWALMGGATGVEQSVANSAYALTSFAFVPVPMFMLMGELFFRTGLAPRVFNAIEHLLGKVPGRLCYVTLGGGTLFAALSGSSMANTAMMGSMMVPEMTRRGYRKSVIMGPIMAAGGLAILIPPSGLAVLLGALGRIDIGKLLIGGIVPGLMLAVLYFGHIWWSLRRDPSAAPPYEVEPMSSGRKLRSVAVNVLPMGLVIFAVIGSILFGWATPTEASAFGVLAVLALAIVYRCLTWKAVRDSIAGALRASTMVLFILLGSATFSQLLAFSGASSALAEWATGFALSHVVMVISMFVVISLLGLFMDEVSMMMLTLPVFIPIAMAMNIDLVWLGVVLLMSLEVGLLSPPFGLLLFVMQGVAPKGTTLGEVTRAAMPYLGWQLLVVAALIAWPPLATWLPSLIG